MRKFPSELIFEVLRDASGRWQARGCNSPLRVEAADWTLLREGLRSNISRWYAGVSPPEDRDIHLIYYPESSP